MSDPVSNVEIEDVLSSIRRLVSEETGAQPRPSPVRQPRQESRLVLTPALRVSDEVSDIPVSGAEPEEFQQAEDGTPWSKPDSTLFMAAQIEPDTDFESEGVDEALLVASDKVNDLSDPDVSDTMDEGDSVPADAFVVSEEEPSEDTDSISEAGLEWAEDDAPVQDDQAEDSLDKNDDAPQDDLLASSDPEQHEDEPTKMGFMDDLTPLSAKIEALETVIGETQDQWEPDGLTGDDYAGTPVQTLRWQDHEIEETASYEPEGQTSEDVEEAVVAPKAMEFAAEPGFEPGDESVSELDFLAGDDSLMDEESLRELVADIVRQELQGALGERITRNVRKLVRREIHRALTTQQLD